MKWVLVVVGAIAIAAAVVGIGRWQAKKNAPAARECVGCRKAPDRIPTPRAAKATDRPPAPASGTSARGGFATQPSLPGPGLDKTTPVNRPPQPPAKSVFDGEARDGSWATDQEAKLRAAVRQIEGSDAAIGEVECRKTTCRIGVAGTPAAVVELVERLSEDRAFIAGSQGLSLSRLPDSKDRLEAAVFLDYLR